MNEETEKDQQEWKQATLNPGFIVKIKGIPFETTTPVTVRSHSANFSLAELEPLPEKD